MNREEFMRQLERLLWELPVNDREDAIAYYQDYFDEAGVDNEKRVMQELGSPEKVAAMIKADRHRYGNGQGEYTERGYSDGLDSVHRDVPLEKRYLSKPGKKEKTTHWVWIIVLLILASPMILGLGGGVVGVLVGIIASIATVFLAIVLSAAGILVGGIVCFVMGIFRVFGNPLEGLVTAGIGAILTAVGILLTLFCVWMIVKWIPALVNSGMNFCKKIFRRGERGTIE